MSVEDKITIAFTAILTAIVSFVIFKVVIYNFDQNNKNKELEQNSFYVHYDTNSNKITKIFKIRTATIEEKHQVYVIEEDGKQPEFIHYPSCKFCRK